MTTSSDEQQTRGPSALSSQEEVPLSVDELDKILLLQQAIFAKVANNDDYQSIVDKLCSMAESFLPNSIATVMLLDDITGLLNVFSAPNVPEVGIEALKGLKPGCTGGSCGNAVYSNKPVFVVDTFTDPRWLDIRHIAVDFNLCSCWSNPVRNEAQVPVGSFALSSFEHRAPSTFHKRLLEVGSSIVSIVLARHKQDQALVENRQRLELMGTALSQSTEGVLVTDAQNRIVEANQAFETITGYSVVEVIGRDPNIFSSDKQDDAFYQQMWGELKDQGRWHGEIVNRRKDGSEITQWMSLNIIRDDVGDVRNHVAVFTDLTELKEGKEQLVYALEHDQLSGLPNKSKLSMMLDADTHERSLILLNVDNFSYINTAYGLEFGDKLLCAIARRLQEIALATTVYRINADEYGLYFDQPVDLMRMIGQIQNQFFSQQILVDDLGFNITLTYGGVSAASGIFGKAIQALGKARELGKNHFHIYNEDSDEPDQAKRLEFIRWNSRLHDALNDGRVMPYFQGIRDNRSGEITHYEALVRLEHEGKVYSPYLFLDVARLSGLLPTITRLVIEQGFAAIAGKNCSLSVNITEEDLNLGYLEEYLDQKTQLYGIKPERVTLEILEGVSATGKKNHISQLSALKSCGYQLAIDDFGTEYSNFERILELNVDCVKIDAKYIKNIVEDKTSYEVTRAIVFFAKNAGIVTVAEFVHNEAVQKIVEELGIEYSQGYLFSEPKEVI